MENVIKFYQCMCGVINALSGRIPNYLDVFSDMIGSVFDCSSTLRHTFIFVLSASEEYLVEAKRGPWNSRAREIPSASLLPSVYRLVPFLFRFDSCLVKWLTYSSNSKYCNLDGCCFHWLPFLFHLSEMFSLLFESYFVLYCNLSWQTTKIWGK